MPEHHLSLSDSGRCFLKKKLLRLFYYLFLKFPAMEKAKNILGTELQSCCTDPITGFFRDGYCNTNQMDKGMHVVCAIVTDAFLDFTKSRGNDLSTPRPEFQFPGLKSGDRWCLCALRWKEAYEEGVAPP